MAWRERKGPLDCAEIFLLSTEESNSERKGQVCPSATHLPKLTMSEKALKDANQSCFSSSPFRVPSGWGTRNARYLLVASVVHKDPQPFTASPICFYYHLFHRLICSAGNIPKVPFVSIPAPISSYFPASLSCESCIRKHTQEWGAEAVCLASRAHQAASKTGIPLHLQSSRASSHAKKDSVRRLLP